MNKVKKSSKIGLDQVFVSGRYTGHHEVGNNSKFTPKIDFTYKNNY